MRGEAAGRRTPRPPSLQWIPVALLAFAVELLLIRGLSSLGLSTTTMAIALPLAHLILVPFLWKNFSFWGIRLLALGLLLNLIVMAVNGGLMPVSPDTVEAIGRHDPAALAIGEYVPGTENIYLRISDTHLAFLSDAIVLPVFGLFTWAVSLGDILIAFGVLIAGAELFVRSRGAVRACSPGALAART